MSINYRLIIKLFYQMTCLILVSSTGFAQTSTNLSSYDITLTTDRIPNYSVAWNPIHNLYYAASYNYYPSDISTYNSGGNKIAKKGYGWRILNLWYNTSNGQLEGMTWDREIRNHPLNAYGKPNAASIALTSYNTPMWGIGGTKNLNNGEILCYYGSSTPNIFYRYNSSGPQGTQLGTVDIIVPPGITFNSTHMIYTGEPGREVGFYDYTNKRVYLYSISGGSYTHYYQLPSGAPDPSTGGFAYANNRFFLSNSNIWYGYPVVISSAPTSTIFVSGSLYPFSLCSGTASDPQIIAVTGLNLTANITVSVPSGFEISSSSGSGYNSSITLNQSGGTVSSTTLYVRLSSSASGTPSGNITLTSTNAITINIPISGTVTLPPTAAPTLVTATPGFICTGQSAQLNATSTSNFINWYTEPIGGSSIGQSVSAANFTVSPSTNTTYYAEAQTAGGNMLGNITTLSNNYRNGSTDGFEFTPSKNLKVIGLRRYSGNKISIWTENGDLIYSQNVSGTDGTWTNIPVSSPFTLNAGQTYRIGLYTSTGNKSWHDTFNTYPYNTGNVILQANYWIDKDQFPNSLVEARTLVDLTFADGSCIGTSRTSVGVSIYTPPSDGGTIAADQAICSGTIPALISSSGLPSGSNGTLEYKWQFSTTSSSSGFSDITGTNSTTYQPAALTVTTWYRRLVKFNCDTDWTNAKASNVITITVNPFPGAVTVSGAGNYCEEATLTATGGSGGTIYWQNTTSGGTSTSTASSSQTVTSSGTYYFRSGTANGCWGPEGSVLVYITPNPAAPSPVSATPNSICAGQSAQLNATSAGNQINWYTQPSGGTSIGRSASAANFTVSPSVNTTYYAETQTTGSNILGNIVHTASLEWYATFGYDFTPNKNLIVTGLRRYSGMKIYIWSSDGTVIHSQDVSGTNGTWTNIPLSNPITLTAGNTYRIGVYDYFGSSYNVNTPSILPKTTDIGIISKAYYQFYERYPVQEVNYLPLVDLTFANPENGCISASRTAVDVSIASPLTDGGTISGDQTICSGTIPAGISSTALPAGSTGTLEYKWQYSTTSSSSGFSDITGANNTTYQPAALFATTWYRRLAKGACETDWNAAKASNVIAITVNPPLTNGGAIAGNQTICSGIIPAGITSSSLPSGSNGTLEYKWQYSTTSSSNDFADISGANTTTYQPAALTATTWYRRLARVACETDWNSAKASNVIAITVTPLPEAITVSGGGTVCGEATLTATGGTGGTIYWQNTTSGGTSIVTASASQTVTESGTYYFRAVSSDGCWGPEGSAVVDISPLPEAPGLVSATPDIICAGQSAQLNATSVGNSINWYTQSSGGTKIGSSASAANFAVSPLINTTYYAEAQMPHNNILGDISHQYSGMGHYTLGYDFTPSSNLTVTGLRRYFGSKIYIWTNTGTLIYSQNVSGTDGTWTNNPLPSPITLTAGTTYRIATYTNNGGYYWDIKSYLYPRVVDNGTIGVAYEYHNGDGFPTNPSGSSATWFVDLTFAGSSCISATRTAVDVEIYTPASDGGTIAGNQSICSGATPEVISSTALPSGSDGTLEYKWQYSTASSTTGFLDISGTNSATYQPAALTATTWYRRLARIDCETSWDNARASNAIAITIMPAPGAVTVSGGGNFCAEATLTATGGTDGTIYWQNTTSGGTSTAIASASQTVTESGTYYFRAVSSDGCWGPEGSAEVNLTPLPEAGTLSKTPNAANVCENDNVAATLTAGAGGNGTDDLQYRTLTGSTWSEWTAYISGANISTAALAGVEIRTRRTADFCEHSAYNTVSWIVEPTPVTGLLTKTPDVAIVCGDDEVSAILTPGSGGNGNDELEYRTLAGSTWSAWTAYTSGTSLASIGLSSIEIRTRRLATYCDNSAYTTVSWAIEPTAIAGSLTKTPNVASVCENDAVAATLTAGSGGNGSDELQFRILYGSAWSAWTAYTSGAAIPTADLEGVEIRTRRMSTLCANSDYVSVSWSVEATPVAGTLLRSPGSLNVCENDMVSASLIAGSGGNGTDELEYRTLAGTTWSEWAAYTSGTGISTADLSGVEIRTRRTADLCEYYAYNTVNWIVEPTPVTGVLTKTPDVINVCENDVVSATLTPGSGGNGIDELEYRTLTGSVWTSWMSYTSGADISTADLAGVEIRSRRTASYCEPDAYTSVNWIVEATPVAGTFEKTPDVDAVCIGEPVSAIFTPGNGGNGVDITEYRTNNGIWTSWQPYVSGTVIPTEGLRRVEIRTWRTASYCENSANTTIAWVVDAVTVAGEIDNAAPVCSGENSIVLTNTGYTGSILMWQSSSDYWATYTEIPVTEPQLTVENLTQATQYRTLVQSGVCASGYSFAAEISVQYAPAAPLAISGTDELCAGTAEAVYSTEPVVDADSYEWLLPQGAVIVAGFGTNSILVSFAPDAVSGIITVAAVNECGLGQSSPAFQVTVNPVPETPVITQDGLLLTSSATEGNQWYLNGLPIEGAVQQTYEVTENGDYSCIVTLNSCISDVSNTITVLNVGVAYAEGSAFRVYPVPNHGIFTISLNTPHTGQYTLEIYNAMGVNVYHLESLKVDANFSKQLNLENAPTGVYTLVLRNQKHQFITKMIITRD